MCLLLGVRVPYFLGTDGTGRFGGGAGGPCGPRDGVASPAPGPVRCVAGWPIGRPFSDLTYSTSAINCSSLTRPWNVGMIGWNPSTTFAVGDRIDSRM